MQTFASFVVFLAVLIAQSSSKPCESPQMWEGEESIEIDVKGYTLIMNVSYDAVNKRVRGLLQYDPEGNEYIIHYNEHRLYNIIHKTGKCIVSKYDKPFTPAQVPDNATFVGNAFLGLQKTGFSYKVYYGKFEVEGKKGTYIAGVTDDGCIPFFGKSTVEKVITRSSIYNVELGIKDPSVFTPPKSCDQEVEGPLPDSFKAHMHPRF